MARAFENYANRFSVNIKSIPIDPLNSMNTVEHCHTLVRKAHCLTQTKAPDLDQEAASQTAVKADNDSVDPNELAPTLPVYSALPRLGLSTDPSAPSVYARVRALPKATSKISKYHPAHQTQATLRARNGPQVYDIHQAPIESHVLIY